MEFNVLGPVRVTHEGAPVALGGPQQQTILCVLLVHDGDVVSADRLIDEVWGLDYVGDTKTLDVHIKRLRNKVERDPSNPTAIVTIRGLGYKFAD